MKKFVILLVLCLPPFLLAQSLPLRLEGMGSMRLSVLDVDRQINIFHHGANLAWLIENDSTDWGRYGVSSDNQWGDLHRRWDPQAVYAGALRFSGQKHISDNQVFFGEVDYRRDALMNVGEAIELEPYARDPFVLTDLTTGDFTWYGPQTKIAYAVHPGRRFYIGAGLNYGILQGLKEQNSMPEIVSRRISGSLDLAWRFADGWVLGTSYKPFNRQDITQFERLPDGSTVITNRYRGEIKYNHHVGESDRTARYAGFEQRLQLGFDKGLAKAVAFVGYKYLWHELFDGTTTHKYDGYFQEESWFGSVLARYRLGASLLSAAYAVDYIENWAKEPSFGLLIYQAEYWNQQVTLGYSRPFPERGILLATELQYNSDLPDRRDYLGHQLRRGQNSTYIFRGGLEFNYDQPWRFRAGYTYTTFNEDPVWQYFGDFRGPGFHFGMGYFRPTYQLESSVSYRANHRLQISTADQRIEREHLLFLVQFKQYF